MRIWFPCDSIVTSRVTGHFDSGMAAALIRSVDLWSLRRGRDLSAFHDWEEMENYDAAARSTLTAWTLERRALFPTVHLLVRSMIVQLGVETANLALGRFMTTHRDRAAWTRAFSAALTRERIEFA